MINIFLVIVTLGTLLYVLLTLYYMGSNKLMASWVILLLCYLGLYIMFGVTGLACQIGLIASGVLFEFLLFSVDARTETGEDYFGF